MGQRRGTSLERLPYDPGVWDAILERYPDAEVFHSPGWLDFLVRSQRAEPVAAVVRHDGRPVGHFVGAIVRRFGAKILGSPLPGWGTEYMGFLLEDGANRRAAAEALVPFAFRTLGCVHVELVDKWLTPAQMVGSGYTVETGRTFVVDLEPPEEEIVRRMNSSTRNYVRQAAKRGLRTEIATGLGFAEEYYEQLRDVFSRQGLAPTYQIERVRNVIQTLEPTGQLLLMQVRVPSGTAAASAIVVGRNQTCVLWGNTLRRSEASFHPDELLEWEVMRYWRGRGASCYDMGGGGNYKAKFGGVETARYRFHRSRYPGLSLGREAVRRLARARQVVSGRLDRSISPGE